MSGGGYLRPPPRPSWRGAGSAGQKNGGAAPLIVEEHRPAEETSAIGRLVRNGTAQGASPAAGRPRRTEGRRVRRAHSIRGDTPEGPGCRCGFDVRGPGHSRSKRPSRKSTLTPLHGAQPALVMAYEVSCRVTVQEHRSPSRTIHPRFGSPAPALARFGPGIHRPKAVTLDYTHGSAPKFARNATSFTKRQRTAGR